ncbi:MAG TPA: TlpA disulfide reductase family protein [Aequorivita sp.]|nr:TlpA disulfide reductase family protein [Aequorivita sp.]
MKKILPLILLVISFCAVSQNEIPKVDLKTMDGKTFNSTDLSMENKVVIVSLWATWCVPCLKELDAISEVYDQWQSETNVELIAVSVDDSRTVKRVRPLINGKGWDYTILLDTNNDFQRALGAATVPYTLLIKNNEIVFRHSGYSPGSELELYEKVKELSN